MKSFPAALVALSLVVLASPATADEVRVTAGSRTITVKFDPADLRTRAGGEAFLERIRRAALIVCGPLPSAADANATLNHDMCLMVAADSAIAQAGGPLFADDSKPATS
jgi:UrcA family protein